MTMSFDWEDGEFFFLLYDNQSGVIDERVMALLEAGYANFKAHVAFINIDAESVQTGTISWPADDIETFWTGYHAAGRRWLERFVPRIKGKSPDGSFQVAKIWAPKHGR